MVNRLTNYFAHFKKIHFSPNDLDLPSLISSFHWNSRILRKSLLKGRDLYEALDSKFPALQCQV